MNKILILANNDIGLYKFRKELIGELINAGNKVYISLPEGNLVGKLEKMGCEFINTSIDRRGINPKTDFKLFWSYIQIIKKIKPDMVITYTIKPNIYGGLAARLMNKAYAINITGLGTAFQKEGLLKKLVVMLYKVALKKAKVVYFENTENANEFLNYRIVSDERMCILNGAGVNLEEYPYMEYPSEVEGIRFLFIGRVMKEKGIDELLEAALIIKKQYEDVQFDIVGPLEDDYKEIIEKYVQKGIVVYHGYQEDVRPFIRDCHCFVLPSYHEGMANTLLEAGACGRPLLTTDIPGCREAVENGKTGILFMSKSTEDLTCAIEKFLSYDSNTRKQVGKHQRHYIEMRFDKRKVVQDTLNRL